MLTDLLWIAALGPFALAAVGLTRANDPRRAAALADGAGRVAAFLTLATALAAAAAVAAFGPLRTPTIGAGGIGLGLYLDALSVTVFLLVAFIGVTVVVFSRNYMDGNPGQARFTRRLCVTLAAVLTVIISGNLLLFVLAWTATSLGLNGLLLFYPERQAAVLAARKKFLASRLGDLCLVAALILVHRAVGGLDYVTIFANPAALGASTTPVAVLFAIAALLKSAQFPLHGWLLEVMETPTPVSALLHAGIINAGGFLVLRFSPVIALSAPSLTILAVVGGFTALFASASLLPQTSVKVALAWSTVAQMGFMLLECGLGVFPAALLHLLAHSLYKAHEFLSAGRAADRSRLSPSLAPSSRREPARIVLALGAAAVAATAIGVILAGHAGAASGEIALATVLFLGLAQLPVGALGARPALASFARLLAMALGVTGAWLALRAGLNGLGAGRLAIADAPAFDQTVPAIVVVASFAALSIAQILLPWLAATPHGRALRGHLSNGLYVNTLANRWVLRLWPSPPPWTAGPAPTPAPAFAQPIAQEA